MTAVEPSELAERIAARVAETARRRRSRAEQRQEFAAARQAGLRHRHTAKLKHHHEEETMARRLKAANPTRYSVGRSWCMVTGCTDEPQPGNIICFIHARALQKRTELGERSESHAEPRSSPAGSSPEGADGTGASRTSDSSAGGIP